VDDLPAPQYEVETWLAQALGIAAEAPQTQAAIVREAMSEGHKRCSNRLLHASGYQLRYADYRSGYGAVLASSR
jgi:hypothetical protein